VLIGVIGLEGCSLGERLARTTALLSGIALLSASRLLSGIALLSASGLLSASRVALHHSTLNKYFILALVNFYPTKGRIFILPKVEFLSYQR
jgi:hypothetical protein